MYLQWGHSCSSVCKSLPWLFNKAAKAKLRFLEIYNNEDSQIRLLQIYSFSLKKKKTTISQNIY